MRTLVLGSQGQLGRDLIPRLPGEILAWTRSEIDLAHPASIRERLAAAAPDVVINCAAYNFVDRAEDEPEAAFQVNAHGVRALAIACRSLSIKLVHVSTDYVFGLDAARSAPWQESDAPGPVSVYGLSKLTGEYFVRMECPDHLIVRTCGLYGVWGSGGKGGNFIETMLKLAAQGKTIRVVNDQSCTPSATADVAHAISDLVANRATGLVHVTNSGSCTWYELAKAAFEMAGLKPDLIPITTAEFGAKARRPAYSVLDTSLAARLMGRPMRPWKVALADYLTARQSRTQS